MSFANHLKSMNENNGSSTNRQSAPDSARARYGSFSEAWDAAREDAGSRAREAAPKMKEALEDAAHDIAYGMAFGACFAGYFAKEILPEGLKASLRKGARDGRSAAAESPAGDAMETA